jgi:hypothetical protein
MAAPYKGQEEFIMRSSNDFIDICQDGVFKAVFTKTTPQSRAAISGSGQRHLLSNR